MKLLMAMYLFMCCSVSFADEVSDLRDLARLSQDHRELAIDCLIEVKTNKANGWEGEACEKYKKFSTTGLQAFKVETEIATSAFKAYSKSNGSTKNRVKRGLKQLVLIQENAESIRNVTGKIKAELQI